MMQCRSAIYAGNGGFLEPYCDLAMPQNGRSETVTAVEPSNVASRPRAEVAIVRFGAARRRRHQRKRTSADRAACTPAGEWSGHVVVSSCRLTNVRDVPVPAIHRNDV
jgi:hypothetical protein